MKVGLEKLDTHKGVTVKVLLDSRAMGMFTDKKFAEEQGFKMEKLDRYYDLDLCHKLYSDISP